MAPNVAILKHAKPQKLSNHDMMIMATEKNEPTDMQAGRQASRQAGRQAGRSYDSITHLLTLSS